MRRSLILDVIVRLVFHSALLLGLFLLFTGSQPPGAAAVAALVAGAAVSLRYVAGGIDEVRDTLPCARGRIRRGPRHRHQHRPHALLFGDSSWSTPSSTCTSLLGEAHEHRPFFDIGVACVVGHGAHAAGGLRRATAVVRRTVVLRDQEER